MAHPIKLSDLANRKRRVSEGEEYSEDSDIDVSSTESGSDDDGDDGMEEVVNIDFDFFSGNPDVDFHALKNLLRQLFGPQESNRIQLSKLADLILQSPTTTIKTDGPESDPYCFLSFIDYKEHNESDYAKYLRKTDSRLATFLQTMDASTDKSCALVMSERLINMPPEVVPPLYRITLEDVSTSLGNDEHYDFYLIVSRKYEVNFDTQSDEDSEEEQARERSKKRVKQDEVDYFHVEDGFLEKRAKIQFSSQPRKGVISSYTIIDHQGLVDSINELEEAISTWK